MKKLNGTTLLILLGGAGVGIYLLTRPTPKATGPIDMALGSAGKVIGAAGEVVEGVGEVGGDLAEGVTRLAMPFVKPVASFAKEVTKLPSTLPKVPVVAYETGKSVIHGVESVGKTAVGGVVSGASGLVSTIGGLF